MLSWYDLVVVRNMRWDMRPHIVEIPSKCRLGGLWRSSPGAIFEARKRVCSGSPNGVSHASRAEEAGSGQEANNMAMSEGRIYGTEEGGCAATGSQGH